MLRFCSFLLGENTQQLTQFDTASQRKVTTVALTLFIPILLWFIAGLGAALTLFEQTLSIGIVAGLASALVIFIIDRGMLHTKGSFSRWFRIGLAILAGGINAIIIDGVLYESDIYPIAKEIHIARYTADLNNLLKTDSADYRALEAEVTKLTNSTSNMHADWKAEMQGNGSGRRGVGRIAKELKGALEMESLALAQVQQQLDSTSEEIQMRVDKFWSEHAKPGFLTHIEAMFKLLATNAAALLWWIGVTIFLVLLELLPILIKSNIPETAYERYIAYDTMRLKQQIDAEHHRNNARAKRLNRYSDTEWRLHERYVVGKN